MNITVTYYTAFLEVMKVNAQSKTFVQRTQNFHGIQSNVFSTAIPVFDTDVVVSFRSFNEVSDDA